MAGRESAVELGDGGVLDGVAVVVNFWRGEDGVGLERGDGLGGAVGGIGCGLGGVLPTGPAQGPVAFADGFGVGAGSGGDGLGLGVVVERCVDKFGQVFPEEVPAVDDFAGAHVEEIYREHFVFVVEAENIGVAVIRGGDALLVLHLVYGDDLIAEAARGFKLHVFRGASHAGAEQLFKFLRAAFQEKLDVADRFAVGVGGDVRFHAGA